jgi:GNAT superfamily N-acetyltransferase
VAVQLRTEILAGDIGCLRYLHGTLYWNEHGWDPTFEAYVAAGLAEFVLDHDPARERLWIAERGDEIVGSIAIVRARGLETPPSMPDTQMGPPAQSGVMPRSSAGEGSAATAATGIDDVYAAGHPAQLRWFLVHPDARGQKLGRRLITEALAFCRRAGYRRVVLWTVSGLEAAAHLYRAAGFVRVEAVTHERWGRVVTEERYELVLTAGG